MTRARLWVAHSLIVTIGLASLTCIVTRSDVWPFLTYPMYAELVEGRRELYWLYGESGGSEVPLHGLRYWNPADEQRLGTGLRVLANRPNGQALVRDALARLATHYESLRRSGHHTGPELDALRVFTVRWNLEPDLPTDRPPDERIPIGELRFNDKR